MKSLLSGLALILSAYAALALPVNQSSKRILAVDIPPEDDRYIRNQLAKEFLMLMLSQEGDLFRIPKKGDAEKYGKEDYIKEAYEWANCLLEVRRK